MLEAGHALAVRPAFSCPSGVVPEDQAPYVCEAENVFGKVQAEAYLLVTGHGSLVDLERRGLVGTWALRGGPHGCPSFGTGVSTARLP